MYYPSVSAADPPDKTDYINCFIHHSLSQLDDEIRLHPGPEPTHMVLDNGANTLPRSSPKKNSVIRTGSENSATKHFHKIKCSQCRKVSWKEHVPLLKY